MGLNFSSSALSRSLLTVGAFSIGSGLVASAAKASKVEPPQVNAPEQSISADREVKLTEPATQSYLRSLLSENENFTQPEFSTKKKENSSASPSAANNETTNKPESSINRTKSPSAKLLVAQAETAKKSEFSTKTAIGEPGQTLSTPYPPSAASSSFLPPPPSGNPAQLPGNYPANVPAGYPTSAYPFPTAYPGVLNGYSTPFPGYGANPYPGVFPGYPVYPVGYSPGVVANPYPSYPNSAPGFSATVPTYSPSGALTNAPVPYPNLTVYPPVGLPGYPTGSTNYPGFYPSYPNLPPGYPANYPGFYPSYPNLPPGYPVNYPVNYPLGYPASPLPAPVTNYPPGSVTGYPPSIPTYPPNGLTGYPSYPNSLPGVPSVGSTGYPGYPVNPVPGYPSTYPGTAASTTPASQAQTIPNQIDTPSCKPLLRSSALSSPTLQVQGVYVYQRNQSSARGRLTGAYPITPNLLFGGTFDITTGNAFSDSPNQGFSVNELYLAASVPGAPGLRFAVGQLDLTSYFDRNSFAKDGATQFFNTIFQTNPALSATGIGSRPGLLANWRLNDNIEAKAAIFSSSRNISDFALNGFAGEIGLRFGNAIIRGTYATDRDSRTDAREEAFGVNGEVYIPNLRMGLFARYGIQNNLGNDSSASTYSFGLNFLDLFMPGDRLGLAYGQGLSNEGLGRSSGVPTANALELFYDFRVLPNLRLGFSIQQVNNFTETIAGVRVRTDFDIFPSRN